MVALYLKIRQVLGPSPLQHTGMVNSVPPGSGYSISVHQHVFSSSNPLVAQLFPNELGMGSLMSDSIVPVTPTGLSSPPASWSPGLADTVLKVDARFKVMVLSLPSSTLKSKLPLFVENY